MNHRKCLCSIFAYILLLSSCSSVGSGKNPTEDSLVEQVPLRSLETIVINDACITVDSTIPENLSIHLNTGVSIDGVFYFRVSQKNYAEDGTDTYVQGIYAYPSDGSEGAFYEIPRAYVLHGKATEQNISNVALYRGGMAVLERGFCLKTSGIFVTGEYQDSLLTAYNASGEILYSVDPECMVTQRINPYRPTDGEVDFGVENMYYGDNGTLYMVTEFSVVAVSSNGEKLYETGEGVYIHQSWRTSDGKILLEYSVPASGMHAYAYMDDTTGGFSAPVTLPDPGFGQDEDITMYIGEGWDVYYSLADGFYGMNQGDESPTFLFSWESSGINPQKISSFQIIGENMYFCALFATSSFSYVVFRRPSDDEIEPRIVITLGDDDNQTDYTELVGRFNQSNTKYYIRIRDYQKQVAEGGNTLQEDILAGNAPDIICSSAFSSVLTNLGRKGALVDLNTILDADPSFRDNLLDGVCAYCSTDGKLYQLAAGVTMSGYVGASALLPGIEDWTLENFLSLNRQCESEGILLANGMYRETMENTLLYQNLAAFVDFDNWSCTFDSALFMDTIQYLQSLPTRSEYESMEVGEKFMRLRDGTILLNTTGIFAFEDYLEARLRFDTEEITFLGSPSPDGGRLYLNLLRTFAITADSPVQEGAWQFIRGIMESAGENMQYLSTYKPALEEQAALEMKRVHLYSLTENLGSHLLYEPEYDPKEKILGRLTEEDVAAVIDLIENRAMYTSANSSDATLSSILKEELTAFYVGNVTAAETARRVQSRASLYLAEQGD